VGFVIQTPTATVVDLGTAFGVAVDETGSSDVEVFSGSVEVRASPKAEKPVPEQRNRLKAKEALRVRAAMSGDVAHVERIAPGRRHFVCRLPTAAVTAELLSAEPGGAEPGAADRGAAPAGPVARLQSLVAVDPHLIHHYPLAGAAPEDQRRDRQGSLHLEEVVMGSGQGDGQVDYLPGGPDAPRQAVRPFRAGQHGNAVGAALQTVGPLVPPQAMTVELLLGYDGPGQQQEGAISVALGTRADRRECAFLVAAVDEGRLVHLLDAHAPWLETGYCLVPGHRYYLASSFQVVDDRTIVNTYVADLTAGDRTLKHVLTDGLAPGNPAEGRLGIGKGFDGELAHAYPWPGVLDEIAIYDAALDRSIFESHVEALLR
jgi:hypothetical protein